MSALTRSDLELVLKQRMFAALLGSREGEFFEAKGAIPYDFGSPDGRYELAKDVSAFANSDGGWLVVGLRTSSLPAEDIDEVSRLDLIAETDFEPGRIRGLIKEHVHPSIAGLEVYWSEDAATAGMGVGVIVVPPQKQDSKPFLIAKVVEESAYLKGIVFGYSRRMGGSAIPHTFTQLQQAMRVGMNSMAERMTNLESKVETILERLDQSGPSGNLQEPLSPTELTAIRINDVLTA